MKIALQLYTVRDHCKTGPELLQTLREVKKLGYDGVEFAGFADLPAAEVRGVLEETGLAAVATHESLDRLENGLEELISYCKALGCANIVCAYAPTGSREELDHLKAVLANASRRAEESGMKVLYHNHTQEFEPLDGKRPLDEIKTAALLELDTYWVFDSKVDVSAYLRENTARIGLIHLKDGSLESVPCAIGEGKNDIAGILVTAKQLGYEWVIVENDDPVPDGLSDAGRSVENLRKKYLI